MDTWVKASDLTPTEWATQHTFLREGATLEGRYEVKLEDGRQIRSWWENNEWSVERLKPNLKVAYWKAPKWIA